MSKRATTDDIDDTAKYIKDASCNLFISYSLDKILDEYCKKFFDNIKLYNNKIAPFSKITIENIKEFCDNEINEIKKPDMGKVNAKSCEKFCHYTILFQKEILINIKIIEDELSSSILKLTSSKMKSMSAGVKDRQLFLSGPLQESISSYCKFLSKISGSFSNIFDRLEILMDLIYQVREYNMYENEEVKLKISVLAEGIKKFCSDYLKMYQEYQFDLYDINYKPDKYYIGWWFLNVINKKDDYEEFENLLEQRDLMDFLDIDD